MEDTRKDAVSYVSSKLPEFWAKIAAYKTDVTNGVTILQDPSNDPMKLVELYPALTNEQVEKLESDLGFKLHHEFRDLLLHCNGASFFQDVHIWGIKRVYSETEYIEQFYDLASDQSEYKQGWEHRNWREKDLIVGIDGLGNLIVLNNENGMVSYLDTEFPDEFTDDAYSSIYAYLEEYLSGYVDNVIEE